MYPLGVRSTKARVRSGLLTLQPICIFLSEFDFASANKGTKKFSASPGVHEYKKRSRTTALDDQGCSGSVSVDHF